VRKKILSHFHATFTTSLNRDPVKQIAILKKQCELYATINRLEDCLLKVQILLEKDDTDVIKFIIKVLSPLQSNLSSNGISLVIVAMIEYIKYSSKIC
jgi:hypothetical protein